MVNIRFMHCADLHLDSPFLGLKHLPAELFEHIQTSTFAAFERLVSEAIQKQVDFMIISGDLFDVEDRSIRAQAKLLKQFNRLNEDGIPVYVIHGNHDHLGSFRLDLDMPRNVHIFGEETEVKELTTKSGAVVKLVGFSYGTRHIMENKVSTYPNQLDGDYLIGLLHGSEGSVDSSHERYAPFTLNELKEKNYDYWALGHIHQRQVLSRMPPVVYPGNIQGRHRKETGEKGGYLVELTKQDAHLEFIPCQELLWIRIDVSLEGIKRFGEIFQRISTEVENLQVNADCLIQVDLKHIKELSPEMIRAISNGELLQGLQDEVPTSGTLKWIHSIKFSSNESDNLDTSDPFINDVLQTLQDMSVEEGLSALTEIYDHPLLHRYTEPLDEGRLARLAEETMDIILHPSKIR
ncbi:DNA repair exonuclease [Rossellomorea aquimaris]|uniref:metallophosphoesterase family protein n=1 Tax=Rossellomorea aquimaris TaxID=189382 RepID=UPI001CD2EF02|nr:DNA repair exonuclease [Rossellomorea aquimaris]MCA1056483.1 DNA repair exonuclease [Rossellomorea aquimaris]